MTDCAIGADSVLLQLTDDRPICFHCENRIADDEPEPRDDPDGCPACDDCFDSECFECHDDGSVGWRDYSVTGPDGNLYRQRYADNHFSTCDDCNDTVWHDDTIGTNDGSVCQSCYENGYFSCQGCGDVLSNDEYAEEGYCTGCHESDDDDDDSGIIKPYSDKSANHLGLFGDAKDGIYYGVEIEVECPNGDREEHAETVQAALGEDFAVLKEDGSLSTGFEIVTAPATVQEHAERFKDLMTSGKTRGLKSWDTSTCGMHVHASRKPLSDLAIGKILVFMNDPANQALVHQVAGRSDTRWCKVCEKKVSDAHPKLRYNGSNGDRYTAVNITGNKTIEFRIFKGTLKYESFLKNLEFVRSVITFCRNAGIQELSQEGYLKHVASRKKDYPHLVEFLRTKHFLPSVVRHPSVNLVSTVGEL